MLQHIARGVVIILVVLSPLLSIAKIKDNIACSDCHTMHNSQAGADMRAESAEALLNDSCVGCHSGNNTDPLTEGIPYVFDPAADYGTGLGVDGNTLAGGSFYWVKFGSAYGSAEASRKGHNVAGITDEDNIYSLTYGGAGRPPVPGDVDQLDSQLTCAGETGCHGNRNPGTSDLESLRPASHHVADDPTLGTSVPNSFRFLSGITGLEDPDWEFLATKTQHNQYKGGAGADTISSLCASCHGDFHATGTTPFLRHPTDVGMPDSLSGTEYASYLTYKPGTPVASNDLSLGVLEDVSIDENKRIVSCVSCHRAHGSPYDASLRWNYKDWPGGAGAYNGCGDCHSTKN